MKKVLLFLAFIAVISTASYSQKATLEKIKAQNIVVTTNGVKSIQKT
jgi:hypothetical protein